MTGIVCPRCLLEELGDRLACKACGLNFPKVDGIPWLFKDPQTTLMEWRNRFDYYIQNLIDEANEIEKELRASTLPIQTQERLKLAKDLRLKQVQLVRERLEPLGALARRSKDYHQGIYTS